MSNIYFKHSRHLTIKYKKYRFAIMLSKSIIKYIRSLGTSKNRLQYKSFVVEGDTIAEEWIDEGQYLP